MLLELVFIRDRCFIFNNFTYFATSDAISFNGGISAIVKLHAYWVFVPRVWFNNKNTYKASNWCCKMCEIMLHTRNVPSSCWLRGFPSNCVWSREQQQTPENDHQPTNTTHSWQNIHLRHLQTITYVTPGQVDIIITTENGTKLCCFNHKQIQHSNLTAYHSLLT